MSRRSIWTSLFNVALSLAGSAVISSGKLHAESNDINAMRQVISSADGIPVLESKFDLEANASFAGMNIALKNTLIWK